MLEPSVIGILSMNDLTENLRGDWKARASHLELIWPRNWSALDSSSKMKIKSFLQNLSVHFLDDKHLTEVSYNRYLCEWGKVAKSKWN